jgi:hypothetical protein
MKLYKLLQGIILELDNQYLRLSEDWNILTNRDNLFHYLMTIVKTAGKLTKEEASQLLKLELRAPVGQQIQAVPIFMIKYMKLKDLNYFSKQCHTVL